MDRPGETVQAVVGAGDVAAFDSKGDGVFPAEDSNGAAL